MTTEESKMAQVDLAYDSVGRLGSLTRTANGDPSTTISTNYALDLLDRVTSITHRKVAGEDVSILSGFGYSFDANGRVASYSGPEGSLSFALDANGQLVSVTGARAENYQYDPVGNRSATITAAGNLLLNDGQFAYTYDLEGNRKTRTRISDGQVTEFFWDYRNQLTKALVKDANGVLLKELRFTYDVVNRRVGVWVDGDGAGPADPDQVWTVYDGANPYMDFDGEGQLQARYLYGPGIDELFARIGTGEDPEWFLTDRLGSVRQIVDASGAVLDDIGYDSFGGILSETNPAEGDRFKFTGREYCPELGLYYYRARWYDPAVGRFISQDPIGFSAGDPNLYRYVGNAPGDGIDPSGLKWFDWLPFSPLITLPYETFNYVSESNKSVLLEIKRQDLLDYQFGTIENRIIKDKSLCLETLYPGYDEQAKIAQDQIKYLSHFYVALATSMTPSSHFNPGRFGHIFKGNHALPMSVQAQNTYIRAFETIGGNSKYLRKDGVSAKILTQEAYDIGIRAYTANLPSGKQIWVLVNSANGEITNAGVNLIPR
jgi:RHS repeat-associated protein